MRRLLRNTGWLLLPKPSEEWVRKTDVVIILYGAGASVTGGFLVLDLGSPLRSFLESLSNPLVLWVQGIFLLAIAALHKLPADWRRARLGARVVCTLSFLVFAPSFLVRFLDFDPNQGRVGDALVLSFALAWVVLVLIVSYFVNRRRARRSSQSAA